MRFSTHSVGWWTIALWMFGSRSSVDVPACGGCRVRVRRRRRARFAIEIVLIAAAVVLAFKLLGEVRGPLRKWALMGAALLLLLPFGIAGLFFPPPFDMTATSRTITYEFRDEEYAHEFALLNDAAVHV